MIIQPWKKPLVFLSYLRILCPPFARQLTCWSFLYSRSEITFNYYWPSMSPFYRFLSSLPVFDFLCLLYHNPLPPPFVYISSVIPHSFHTFRFLSIKQLAPASFISFSNDTRGNSLQPDAQSSLWLTVIPDAKWNVFYTKQNDFFFREFRINLTPLFFLTLGCGFFL